ADVADARLAAGRECEQVAGAKERSITLDGNTRRRLHLCRSRKDHRESRHDVLNETAAVEAALRGSAAMLVASADLGAGQGNDRVAKRRRRRAHSGKNRNGSLSRSEERRAG